MNPFRKLRSRIIAQNPWYTLRQDDLILPNGEEIIYNVVHKANAVWIVPVLEDGRVVLINQYRHPIEAWCWELPAGGIPDGQDPESIARRELKEEIGGQAAALTFLGDRKSVV